MNRQYPDNIAFRIIFPWISGMILYLAMLTIFDSLDQLADSFFSQEAVFIIILTFFNHELAVWLIKRRIPNMVFYFTIVISSAALVNSALTVVYFVYILGYMHFRTELLTINILFLVFHALVNLYYLSIVHISRVRVIALQREEDLAKQLELELESFQSEMNPGLLMTCLETLINLIHKDTRESEKYISTLSNQYRYILDKRHMEITNLSQEIEAASELVFLLGYNIEPGMTIETQIKDGSGHLIIPGTLLSIINWIYNNMITGPLRPIRIHISIDASHNILVSHAMQARLQGHSDPAESLIKLNRSYTHYTGSEISTNKDVEEIVWHIPQIPEIREND